MELRHRVASYLNGHDQARVEGFFDWLLRQSGCHEEYDASCKRHASIVERVLTDHLVDENIANSERLFRHYASGGGLGGEVKVITV
jgi:hypothetical protein